MPATICPPWIQRVSEPDGWAHYSKPRGEAPRRPFGGQSEKRYAETTSLAEVGERRLCDRVSRRDVACSPRADVAGIANQKWGKSGNDRRALFDFLARSHPEGVRADERRPLARVPLGVGTHAPSAASCAARASLRESNFQKVASLQVFC